MNRRNQSILAGSALVAVFAAAMGLGSTEREAGPASDDKVQLASFVDAEGQKACASAATYDRLKQVLFNDALKVRNSEPGNLQTLAEHSVVRMENPVLESRDQNLGVTTCSGTFILELPPGSEQAFGGERRLTADISYTARRAPDGSGLVYQLNGAERIMAELADFNLQGRPYVPTGQPDVQFAEAPPLPDGMLGMGGPEEPEPTAEDERAAVSARSEAEAEDREARRESEARVAEAARDERAREQRRAERARRAEARPARGNSRPSFNCRHARTRSELMVCDSQRLAARDREMSALFYSAMDSADPRTRRELNRTRDRFLAYRDRCRSEDCVADAYVGRMREIEDIMASR